MGDLNGVTTWLKICFFTRFSFIYFNFSFLYQWYSDLKHKSDWDSKKEPFFYLLFISYFFCMKNFLIFISYTILLSFYGLEIYNTPIFDTFFGGIPLFILGWSFLFSSKRNLILLFLKILNYSNKIQLISQNSFSIIHIWLTKTFYSLRLKITSDLFKMVKLHRTCSYKISLIHNHFI